MPFPIIPVALGATSLLGSILGHKGGIDMKAWERMFGPQAMAALTNQFMSQFQNSPWARQQELGAANTGQQIANNFAAMPGARTSGVGQISQALSGGATNSLQQQLMAMLFQMAQQAAQQQMSEKQGIFLHNQQQPSFLQQFGPALSGAASQTLSMLPTNTQPAGPAKVTGPLAPPWSPPESFIPGQSNWMNPAGPWTPQPTSGLSFFDQFQNRAVGAR